MSFIAHSVKNYNLLRVLFLIAIIFFLNSCGGAFKPKKSEPISGPEKARKNIEEGRGVSIGNAVKGLGKGTTYEFSTANPMWRASLEALDFLPLTTVDYSGGIIITDWYYGDSGNSEESIKISIRFLSNEIRTDSLKITLHQRICESAINCKIDLIQKSNLREELRRTILKKASLIEKEQKEKK